MSSSDYGYESETARLALAASETVEWLSIRADADGRVFVTDVIDGATVGPIETAGYPLADWLSAITEAVNTVARATYTD